jgi:nucleoside-diphosphate-sugar epimerase
VRLFVLGATGRTGTELVDLALAAGHEITAFVRSPAKITRRDARLVVMPGDPRDATSMASALTDHDVVVSALGPSIAEALHPSTLLYDCARSTVTAMDRARVDRLLVVSSALLFPGGPLYFGFFRWMIRHHLRDLRRMEDLVTKSGAAWTIARPPRLTRATTERYRAEVGVLAGGPHHMSFRSVAAFLLDAGASAKYSRQIVGLAG